MRNGGPMPLLLIEDDAEACGKFLDCAQTRTDIVFIGVTGRCGEAMRLLLERSPEGVILDLELTHGQGSGLTFLQQMNNADLRLRPIVVVTTRNRSELVHESLHEYGVDWVFCKRQETYSQETVIDHLLALRPFLHIPHGNLPSGLQTPETPEQLRERVLRRIDAKLNTIGVPPNLKGRPYLREAIFRLVTKDKDDSDTVFHEVANVFRNRYNNVIRNMQAAIHSAWMNSATETLEQHYRAPVRSSLGVPSPTEFVYYYADQIRRTL